MHNLYIRIDCDNVGDKIELALYNNDAQSAQKISDTIKDNIKWFVEKIINNLKAEVLLIGSDDILYKTNEELYDLNELENLRQEFYKRTNITLSIGIGHSISQSLVNLNIAKISGKNKIVTKFDL
jgi:hypothetical protein